MIQLGCNRCVHEGQWDSNYMGNCETCNRNPEYVDFYFEKQTDENICIKCEKYDSCSMRKDFDSIEKCFDFKPKETGVQQDD